MKFYYLVFTIVELCRLSKIAFSSPLISILLKFFILIASIIRNWADNKIKFPVQLNNIFILRDQIKLK